MVPASTMRGLRPLFTFADHFRRYFTFPRPFPDEEEEEFKRWEAQGWTREFYDAYHEYHREHGFYPDTQSGEFAARVSLTRSFAVLVCAHVTGFREQW